MSSNLHFSLGLRYRSGQWNTLPHSPSDTGRRSDAAAALSDSDANGAAVRASPPPRQPNYNASRLQEALEHLASIDLIELCNEAKVECCRATRDLRSCGHYVESVLNSCGHASLCTECCQRCDSCPICRIPIPKNGNVLRLRLYYECIEAGLISKKCDDRLQEKEYGEKQKAADIERLYSFFDVAIENNLVSLICHYVTAVCLDESAVSSDPVIAFLLDEVVVKDWCKRRFKNILTELQGLYDLSVENMKMSLSSLLKFSVKLSGISNLLEVLDSSFKGTLSAQLHDLYHLQESILKTKQHMEIMIWCIRHHFLENVGSQYTNFTSWRSSIRERKSAAIKRSWPDSVNHSAESARINGSTLFIEDALLNIGIEQGYTHEIGGELEIASLQKVGSSLFFRSKIEGMAGCYPFGNLRAAVDILFLRGSSDLVIAKQAIFLYYLFDRHWTRPEEEWRHIIDDFAATFNITRIKARCNPQFCLTGQKKGNADEGSQLYRNALQVLTDSKRMPLDDNVMEKMIDLPELLHLVGRYPAINKPAGVVHWLKHSKDAQNVDWVVILDADMIMRGPIIPWEIGAEKGRPVAAYYGYLIGCDNILAQLHTKHPELCDKVGGLLAMHIDDLRALAPMWLSKTEEVRADTAHWAKNITGDIYEKGWISEMYGYSFGAAEVGLRHKINDNLMIYPSYIPRDGVEPILMHYGLPFSVGNWSFSKLSLHEDSIVYDCGRLFPEPPYPREVTAMEADPNKRRAFLLNLECINTLNEGLLLQHAARGCPKPKWSKYLSFLKSKTFAELTRPKFPTPDSLRIMEDEVQKQVFDEPGRPHPKIHTIFSTECTPYFDWQTVGLVHSFNLSGQPGNITRLLSCTDEDLKFYAGHNLAPTHYVPSMSRHPLTGDWYPAINKPASVLHWLNHANVDAEFIVILDADMIMRGPITPWEFKAARGRPVSTPYDYLIGCDNELAKLHTSNPKACDKVGGVIIMHIDDLRKFALLWLHKTEEVRSDTAHYAKNITGDIYESGWISEMYGYSFGAAELNLRHVINREILIYPGYVPEPGVKYRVFHYGLEFSVGNWSFDKANWRNADVVNKCWAKFPDPPDPSTLDRTDENIRQRDLLSIECAKTLNEALRLHHEKRKCPDPNSLLTSNQETTGEATTISRKFGKIDTSRVIRSSPVVSTNVSQESSLPAVTNETLSSFRVWIVGLWVFSILGFLAIMYVMLAGRKGLKRRGKNYKTKRRASYSGFVDLNGHDRHLRNAEKA